MMDASKGRPFKVWSSDRLTKKSVVVKSLDELIHKGKTKLEYSEVASVCLEEDGTIVEDEAYFDTLDNQTVLILLKEGQTYTQPWEHGEDELDFVQPAGPHESDQNESLLFEVTRKLRYDIAKLVTLDDKELQVIVDADAQSVCERLNCSLAETQRLQETCQRYLDERRNAAEAIEAVKLLTDAKTAGQESQNDPQKRKKYRLS